MLGQMERIAVTGGSGFIGTSLIGELSGTSQSLLLNLDKVPPKEVAFTSIWRPCNILNSQELHAIFAAFNPTMIVHLAGRTDMQGKTITDYEANHIGTTNLIAAIKRIPEVRRVVFTSSQFVVRPGAMPSSDLDFRPHTIYGESKAESERAIQGSGLSCTWTIIRPTNIWGRWHPRYPSEFWKVLKQGRYFHPGKRSVCRSYGYVRTVAKQICAILRGDKRVVDRQIFYVGDPPIDLLEWTNAFSRELRGTPVRIVPRSVVRGIAIIGDIVIAAGGEFPLFTSRYQSMTESYPTPMTKTFDCFGMPTITLEEGVKETVAWLRDRDSFWR